MVILGLLSLAACKGGGGEPPAISTATLPDAVAGEIYRADLVASGGAPPLVWSLTSGELPAGLVLNPGGAISGIPVEAGEASIDVAVVDADDGRAEASWTLTTAWPADAVPCGSTLTDHLKHAADEGGDVDWEATDGYRWLVIPLPPPDITRIDLLPASEDTDWTAWLGAPGVVPGDEDLARDFTSNFPFFSPMFEIDLASSPFDLQAYRALGAPLTVLVVASDSTDFGLTTDCSDGPVLEQDYFDPVRLGEGLDADWNAVGIPDAVFSTDDPLPPGLSMDTDGHVTGLPTEAGAWDLTLHVVDPAGPTRDIPTSLGVYDLLDVPCGAAVDLDLTVSQIASPWAADPRSFAVLRTPIPAGTSAVTATLDGPGFREIATARPGSTTPWLGGGEFAVANATEIAVAVTPRAYPPLDDYLAEGEVITAVTGLFPQGTLTAAISCDPAPRADTPGLPVVLADSTWQLDAVGGTPPWIFSASGLPSGVTLGADGTLAAAGATPGASTVDLTVTDALGAASSETYSLYVGATAACAGLPTLTCGDSASGTFTLGIFDELVVSGASTAVLCLPPPLPSALVLGVTSPGDADLHVSALDPGRSSEEALLSQSENTEVVAATAGTGTDVALDASTWPSVDDWADLPLLLAVQAYYPGDWQLSLDCP